MKAALLVESLTGNTWKAAERIATDLEQERWTITGLTKLKEPDYSAIQDADIVLIGTWVHVPTRTKSASWMAAWSGSRMRFRPVMVHPSCCNSEPMRSPAFHVLPVRLSIRIAAFIRQIQARRGLEGCHTGSVR